MILALNYTTSEFRIYDNIEDAKTSSSEGVVFYMNLPVEQVTVDGTEDEAANDLILSGEFSLRDLFDVGGRDNRL